jgi:Pretoxin HINT domain
VCESFTAGTRILLADGKSKPISQLKPGDRVLATNVQTGETQTESVAAILLNRDTDLYDLKIKTAHGTAVVHTTSSHLFFDLTRHLWIKAAALPGGSHLRTPAGISVTVLGGYAPADTTGWMWDLTVQADHDFYVDVGATAVLVHNCSRPQGVHSFPDLWNPGMIYVGKAMNFHRRLGYWVKQGRLSSIGDAECLHVCGTEDDVFIAEYQQILALQRQGILTSNMIAPPGEGRYNERDYYQLPLWDIGDGVIDGDGRWLISGLSSELMN